MLVFPICTVSSVMKENRKVEGLSASTRTLLLVLLFEVPWGLMKSLDLEILEQCAPAHLLAALFGNMLLPRVEVFIVLRSFF